MQPATWGRDSYRALGHPCWERERRRACGCTPESRYPPIDESEAKAALRPNQCFEPMRMFWAWQDALGRRLPGKTL